MKRLAEITKYIDLAFKEITNINIKHRLENLEPRRSFIDRITNKDITLKEYNRVLNELINILYLELIEKYPFTKFNNNTPAAELTNTLITFYNIFYSTHFSNNKAKIYPISLDEKTAQNIYEKELRNIIHEHLLTGRNYEYLTKEKIRTYTKKINIYKETLKKVSIEPYYGTPKFMYEHALFINECLLKLPFKVEDQTELLEEMSLFIAKYPEKTSDISSKCYPYFNKTYQNDYENFEKNYLKILNYENSLVPEVSNIWQTYLTNPENHNNSSFKYLIHTFSSGLVDPQKMTKACCTLVSDKLLTTPYGNSGLIYAFTPESIEAICYEDAKSWVISKDEFIDRNLPLTWQLTPNNLFYENPKTSKLLLPTELEKYAIANNLIHNKELLNYTNHQTYTELLLNSQRKAIGVFYTDNCQNIEEIKAYAKKYNLPLVHLSLKKLRVQTNLNPIPTKNKPEKEASSVLHH